MGALLCLSADYRLGVRGDFKIGLNEVAIGMTLPWFGVELARARLDETQFTQAVALARIYDPDSAVAAGYLDRAVDAADLDTQLDEMLQGLSTLNMGAHRETKRRIREPLFARLALGLERDFASGAGTTAGASAGAGGQ
jgi:enoyl-CoA hydratase